MQDNGGGFVTGFAFQVPTWLVLVIVVMLLFGAWKLGKLIWSALSR